MATHIFPDNKDITVVGQPFGNTPTFTVEELYQEIKQRIITEVSTNSGEALKEIP